MRLEPARFCRCSYDRTVSAPAGHGQAIGRSQTGVCAASRNPKHATPRLPGLAGTYAGTLQAGDAQLHLVLHLIQNPDGTLGASLDSLDQAVFAIEASHVAKSESKLNLDVASVGAHFEGKISPDHQTIDGTWTQGNAALPLVFHRRAASSAAQQSQKAQFSQWKGTGKARSKRMECVFVFSCMSLMTLNGSWSRRSTVSIKV